MPGQRQDYLLRQLEMLRHLVARLTGQREPAGLEEALQISYQLQEKLFAMPAADFLRQEVGEQVATLARNESPQRGQEKILTYAGLLRETAQVYDFRGHPELAQGARQLALHVALHVALDNPPHPDAAALVAELRDALELDQLYPPVRAMLEEFSRLES
jgi:hypothetical protein